MSTILVTGAASGLGKLIHDTLWERGHDVHAYDRALNICHDVTDPSLEYLPAKLDILINCAGVNGINWLEDVTDAEWDQIMDVNAKGIFKMTQALLPELRESKGTVLNIVSNASDMPMRCSAAYNASKGAAAILSRQLARELIGDGITVFAISPNKLADTGMSHSIDKQVCETRGWTLEEAQAYQLKGLLTGKETDPRQLAEFIAYLLADKARHEMMAGTDIPYGL